MPFTLEVRFFGLCHFIRNINPVSPGGVGMCVVLAAAGRHDSKVTVNQGTLTHSATGAPFPGPLSQFFDFKPTGGQIGTFIFNSVVNDVHAALDFNLLLPGGLAKADPDIIRPEPPPVPSAVQAQILLRGGTLGPDPNEPVVPWNLPASVFNSLAQSVSVAAKALWTLTVDSANVSVKPFGGGQEELYVITPDGTSNKAALEISNECSGGSSTIDEDFIFHYNLLDPGTRAEIVRRIGGLDLQHLKTTLPSRGGTQSQVLLSHFKNNINVTGEGAEVERLLAELGRINSKFSSGGPTGCNCLTCSNGAADIKFQ